MITQRFGTVVVGAGQAGLAAGHHLAAAGADFVILEAGQRIGDAWRNRWDSLRLFTPPGFNHLPGMRLQPRHGGVHTKDDMADYLEAYAGYFRLPVRLGLRAEELTRNDGQFIVGTAAGQLAARTVIVATGPYRTPRVPVFAGQLDPAIVQLHSSRYRNPAQLRDGAVLVVGAGNSGAEIALELAGSHPTWLAGRDTGYVPFPLGGPGYRAMSRLSVHAWPGRTLAAMGSGRGHPLIRVTPADLAAAPVWRVPRVTGVRDGQPVLEDGCALPVENVIWCTGFGSSSDYEWIKLPVCGPDGRPGHRRGVAIATSGLYFLGLPFQSSLVSHLVGGVAADARYITSHISSGDRQACPPQPAPSSNRQPGRCHPATTSPARRSQRHPATASPPRPAPHLNEEVYQ